MKNQQNTIQAMISNVQSLWKKFNIKPKSLTLDDDEDITVGENSDIVDQNHIWSMSFIFWFA